MTRKLLCKSRKSLTHVAVQTTVRSLVKAKDNSLGWRGWKDEARGSGAEEDGGAVTVRCSCLSELCHERHFTYTKLVGNTCQVPEKVLLP